MSSLQSFKLFFISFFVFVASAVWAQNSAKIEPIMATIPTGQFFMGEQSDESRKDEVPVHVVTIKSFKLSKTEITVGQYRQFVLASGYMGGSSCVAYNASNSWAEQPLNWMSPNVAPGDYNPVVCVNWDDAKAYVSWLAKKTGKKYRLPTEAEWEYAARAGTATKYYFGNDTRTICNYGNLADLTGKGVYGWAGDGLANCEDLADFTAPVGSYAPNKFGLYDMVGNVWEWTEDCYHDTYNGAPSNGSAWTTGECKYRVLRGGSWDYEPVWARSANRALNEPAYRNTDNGFRIAQDI